ncbi:HNH endonuclease [Plantactinospora sp. KLBMP9567]|uniref:HNH endonuclease n=1 Tax=Plantactinospora sp. KLBMP9567 TaxID=3085900 RepID=UPI0029811981|nr:HNH endonuclease [Plantactinospora sp. KLBMP9567]MDW5326043.1 HNH endonuclease [Plantactinospora sp. KLBMP9567]
MNNREIIEYLTTRSVIMPASEGGCWLWEQCRNQDGYGVATVNGRTEYAHRASMRAHGFDLSDLTVDHQCANRHCWNPAHLELCTRSENTVRTALKRWGAYRRITELTGVGDFRP